MIIRTGLASLQVIVRPVELLDLIDNREQHFQCWVGRLPVPPANAELARSSGVNRELNPRDPATRVRGVGPTADDQLRVEPLYLFPEAVQRRSLDLGVRT